jgi:hypothetical protein
MPENSSLIMVKRAGRVAIIAEFRIISVGA